ncbi:Cyclin pch1 [Zalerion maritima]|uniref:RNA polymerase II holoenzyme cyclin-like subunit n=1 Tax=Zalerion maritima TaxID=339359 RepID=A0AAD5RNR1_9PEZI|nr:Cyclin pch1 [Zalerion maritima]
MNRDGQYSQMHCLTDGRAWTIWVITSSGLKPTPGPSPSPAKTALQSGSPAAVFISARREVAKAHSQLVDFFFLVMNPLLLRPAADLTPFDNASFLMHANEKMANIDRYRPPQRAYEPPVHLARTNLSPSRRRDIPPAVPSPPVLSSRTSPPRPLSRRSAPTPRRASEPPSPATRRKQWIFTNNEIISSPSVLDGLSPAEERLRRAKGVNFIYQAGVKLDLPQVTLWVAGVFFHRFYMRRSMVESCGGSHHYNIAATAVFLANKTEENCRKTKDIIVAVAKVAQKNANLQIDEQSKEYWRWRDSILMHEEMMLELLTFDLKVENPFNCLYKYLRDLQQGRNKALRHAAWAFCSDACLTQLPLMLEAEDMAVAAIFFSSIYTGEKIDDMTNGEPWWKSFETEESACTTAIEVMAQFYEENPLRKTENPMTNGRSPIFILDSTRRRGETISSSVTGTPMGRDGTQSPPRSRTNGGPEFKDPDRLGSDVDVVHRSNGNGAVSPAKRKTPDDDDGQEDSQSQKRPRQE